MPLLHWRKSSHAAAISLPITIAPPSHHPLRCCCCPSLLPPLPIAAATIHRDIAAAVYCDCYCHPSCVTSHSVTSALAVIVHCPPSVYLSLLLSLRGSLLLSPSAYSLFLLTSVGVHQEYQRMLRGVSYSQRAVLRVSSSQQAALRVWCSQCALRASYSQLVALRVWCSQHEGTLVRRYGWIWWMLLQCLPALPLQPPAGREQSLHMRGGELLPASALRSQQQQQVHFLAATKWCHCQRPRKGLAGMRGGYHKGGGMENNLMLLLLSTADQSKLPRVIQNPLPTAGPILCFHCCIIGVLWYLFRVLTYHTHITTLWHIPANSI